MTPDREVLVGLVHALLANARSLVADARLLLDHGRWARAYALAALGGEELGKLEVCLDWLIGQPLRTPKEFRRAWQDHSEKLANLTAYRAAFMDDPTTIQFESLRHQAAEVGRRKMAAIYVDFDNSGIQTPDSISAAEAQQLLAMVEAAVGHASGFLAQLTPEVPALMDEVSRSLIEALAARFDGMEADEALPQLRAMLDRLPTMSDEAIASLLKTGDVSDLWVPNTRDEGQSSPAADGGSQRAQV